MAQTATAAPATAEDYDPFRPDFYTSDPFGVYRRLRNEAPVAYNERWGWWVLTRFEDVRAAALDADTFRSFEGMDIDDSRLEQVPPGSIGSMDNPRHDQVRSVVQPYFLPRRIAQLEDGIRAVVRDLVGTWRDRATGGRATVDLAQELAWPMPFDVFFHLMGLPSRHADDPLDRARREQLEHWTHELKDRVPGTPHLTPVARAATAGVQQFFIDLLEDRRRAARDDLVTAFVEADIDGVPFVDAQVTPDSEVSGLMMILFLGGVESTAGLTGTLFRLLAENPDQRALLQADPSLIPAAVEEAMRLITPLQLTARTTSREVTLHGVTIPAGGRVVLVMGAANRDERQFPDPDRFDVTRPRGRHLGFGEGVHGCLGAPLARLEARIALEEALPVLGDYEPAGPPTFYPSSPNMYVWKNLPVTFGRSTRRPHVEAVSHRTTTVTLATSEFEAEARVAAKQEVADGVVALTLREAGDRPLPAWEPGAHVDLVLDGTPTRQYSLCGDPTDHSEYRLGVLRDPDGRGSSLFVHHRLQAGDTVRVRGPRNNFPLVDSPRYLFIAGGIGITPILAMIRAAEAAGADWRLVYGGRHRASMAFLDELAVYGDRVSVRPQDETGLLDLEALLGTPQPDTLVYCCGPEPLLAAVEEHCAGWPRGALHVERFAPRPQGEPARTESFEVELARSELTLTVPPDRSILSVVEEAGVGVLSSCAEGTCGTCETGVLGGVPDHRDSVLGPDEREANDCMMICVSRASTDRLVLDL
ncbi:cytochrome P450/ferredoxin-NADP reductase [Geodermatophilus bullaregiensis]|uniref:cytochrome P450 n=1 Tax=Geodermatophilus bullaregiensis TaxID=1564160 RepID=UPI0019598165|nr:cytochrome P450 [Geodermatophilus bullaregiensis]MBM7804428.1 cytochrome P450/ferredoxin-NADP reductase [Geodermatophilus bullaregiensis]